MNDKEKETLIEREISSKEVYKGHLLDVYEDEVLLSNGVKSRREYIRHCLASAVLAFDEENNIILEEQFRYPFHDVIKELPAGKADGKEDPLEVAKRELLEETGYEADEWTFLGEFYPSVAYTDESIYLYEAHSLHKKERHLDVDENLIVNKVPFDEFIEMVNKGEIRDGKTLGALAYYLAKHK